MKPIETLDLLRERTDDSLLLWAAGELEEGRASAWEHAGAIGVACARLARRERLAVAGDLDGVEIIAATVLRETGVSYRPIGDEDLVHGLCSRLPGFQAAPSFGWMESDRSLPSPPSTADSAEPADASDEAAIEALLQCEFPASLARPGLPGVGPWWVVRDEEGIAASAADAFSGGGVGMLAGVVTARRARGRGIGREVVATALASLRDRYEMTALMVEEDNPPARTLYSSLGMTYRRIATAAPAGSSWDPE